MAHSAVAIAVSILALSGCTARPPAPDSAAARGQLLQADRDFARATAQRGMDGWMEAYTADAVRLTMGGAVARGHEAIREFDASIFEDPDVRLVWTPTDGGAFSDGHYGWTTGTSFMHRVSSPTDTLWQGRYVTLWRREADGRWRVVLDTGASD